MNCCTGLSKKSVCIGATGLYLALEQGISLCETDSQVHGLLQKRFCSVQPMLQVGALSSADDNVVGSASAVAVTQC